METPVCVLNLKTDFQKMENVFDRKISLTSVSHLVGPTYQSQAFGASGIKTWNKIP